MIATAGVTDDEVVRLPGITRTPTSTPRLGVQLYSTAGANPNITLDVTGCGIRRIGSECGGCRTGLKRQHARERAGAGTTNESGNGCWRSHADVHAWFRAMQKGIMDWNQDGFRLVSRSHANAGGNATPRRAAGFKPVPWAA